MILARPCSVVVMIPDWLPVNDTAETPKSARAMHDQRRRDALPGADEHVVLARRRDRAHLAGQPDQVVGRLAHGAHHDDHLGALAHGPGDVLGDRADPVGVADRGPAVLLHHEGHPVEPSWRRERRRPGPRPDSGRPCGGR